MKPLGIARTLDVLRILGAAGLVQAVEKRRDTVHCQQQTDGLDSGMKRRFCGDRHGPHTRTHPSRSDRSPISSSAASLAPPRLLAYSPVIPKAETSQRTTNNDSLSIKQYDFVVVGCGAAGRAAVQELAKKCPAASIAVIDPLWDTYCNSTTAKTTEMDAAINKSNLHWYSQAATFLNPRERTVRIASCSDADADGGEDAQVHQIISYRHAILLATGARGAPIPHYIHDDAASSRILNWKTRAPTTPAHHEKQDTSKSLPILLPEQIQRDVLQAASDGQKIAVLGSGWDSVALALKIASSSQKNKRSMLLMGAPGPLTHVLPNYLVTAVTKRLRSKHVSVKDRTLIRYISETPPENALTKSNDDGSLQQGKRKQQQQPDLQIYSAKTFDFLDSQVDLVDWIVAAPDTTGPRGSASLGMGVIPSHLTASHNERRWNQTWSDMTLASMTDPMSIACFQDDGRISVNAELCAFSGVYAAGSVAKVPNCFTGHADVAGEGKEEAADAGRVAARNMTLHYHAARSSLSFRSSNAPVEPPVTKDPIPVFSTESVLRGNDQHSVLSENGISALLVGQCDAERFYTIGVWWTNQAAHRRVLEETTEQQDGPLLRHRKSLPESLRPVYGMGVVYYFDRTGRLQGVMLWGLPCTKKRQAGVEVNPDLLREVKGMIRTNGGFQSVASDAEQIRMTNFLTDAAHTLVRMSLSPGKNTNTEEQSLDLPRPLLRFTQVRRNSIRTGVLKRKEGHSFGVLGADLFARYQRPVEEVAMARPDMSRNVGYAAQQAQDQYDWNVWEQKEAQWEENEALARPPREDPLWIRKGDEVRQTSAKDNLLAAFNKALWGRST